MDSKETKVYRYACLMRPPGPGGVPKQGLVDTKCVHFSAPSGHRAWGLAEYTRELTDEEVEVYELEEIEIDDHTIPGTGGADHQPGAVAH